MNDIGLIFFLLVVFQMKHLVVDFFLQNAYMLAKFNVKGWFKPLMAHTGMHGTATLVIALLFGVDATTAIYIAMFDIIVHTVVDKLKVEFSRDYDKNKDKEFWWWLGIDQMLHHLTHYTIILFIIAGNL